MSISAKDDIATSGSETALDDAVQEGRSPGTLYALPIAVIGFLMLMYPELIIAAFALVGLIFLVGPILLDIDDCIQSIRDRYRS